MQISESSSRQLYYSNGFDAMHVVCTDLLCVVCIGLLSAEFSTVNTGLGRPMFGNFGVCRVLLKVWPPQTIDLHRLLKFSTQK